MNLARFALLATPLLLAAQQPAGVAPQPTANPKPTKAEDLCSIEGQVLNAFTAEPLKRARVTMFKDEDYGIEHGTATDATDALLCRISICCIYCLPPRLGVDGGFAWSETLSSQDVVRLDGLKARISR